MLLALGWLSGAHSQTNATSEDQDLTALEGELLLQRAQSAADVLTALDQRRGELLEQAQTLGSAMGASAVERQGFELAEVDHPAEAPRDPEQAQQLVDQWVARQAGLRQLREILENQRSQAQRHREIALQLAQEAELEQEAQRRRAPLIEELARRLEAETLALEEIPEVLQARVTVQGQGDAQEAPPPAPDPGRWRAAATRDQLLIEENQAALEALAATQREAEGRAQQANAWLQTATRRAQLVSEFSARDSADLSAQLNTQLGDWLNRESRLQERLADLASKQQAVDELQRQLADLQPASPDPSVGADESIESLRQARQALALAEANLAFRQRRQALLQELGTALEALVTALTEGQEATRTLLTAGMELAVMAEVIQDKAPGGQADLPAEMDSRFAERLATLEAALAAQGAALTRAQQRAETLVDDLAEAEKTLAQAQQAIEQQGDSVRREERWATFVQEMESQDAEALIDGFQEAVSSYKDLRREYNNEIVPFSERRLEAVTAAEEALDGHYDPVVLAMIEDPDAFTNWRQGEGLRLDVELTGEAANAAAEAAAPAAPIAPSAPNPLPEGNGNGNGQTAAVQSPPTPSLVEQQLQAARQRRDDQVTRRLNYFSQYDELTQALAVALEQYGLQLDAQLMAAEELLELARRAWGSATALQVRAGRGEVDTALPASLEGWLDRNRVIVFQDEVDALNTERQQLTERLTALGEAGDSSAFRTPLEDWQTNITQRIEQLSDLRLLERTYGQIQQVDQLDELQRRILERDIEERINRDLGLYTILGRLFGSQETATLDDLLQRYYQRLILRERMVANLDSQRRGLESTIEGVEATREPLGVLEAVVSQRLTSAELALERTTVQVKAALQPSQAAELLAEFEQRFGEAIDPTTLPSDGDDEARVQARDQLIQSLRQPWALVAGYRQWRRQLQEELAELGGIDTEVGLYQSALARVDSNRTDLQREIDRLNGQDPEELAQLAADTTVEGEDQRRLLLGEIGLLRTEREDRLNWQAVASTISLVTIPLLALLAILVGRRVGRLMVRRATQKHGDKELSEVQKKEREARSKTLVDISQTAWTAIVIILAALYMLRVINIDVTPIIASLGVLGLAVAFGAQAMMKDLFSGFFLLLENQLNRGDWVVINGITGQVEDIGLRMTVLRDYYDGTLHYLRNGQITLVSSFSREWIKDHILLYVSDEASPDAVVKCLKEVAQDLQGDDQWSPRLRRANVQGGIYQFDTDTGALVYSVFLEAPAGEFGIGREFRKRVKLAFDKAGIELMSAPRSMQRLSATQRMLLREDDDDPATLLTGG